MRAGSKRQDLNAFGGIVTAWQVGIRLYEKEIKMTKNRKTFVEAFVLNNSYSPHIRKLLRKIMLDENEGTTQEELILLFLEFLSTTEPGIRVTY